MVDAFLGQTEAFRRNVECGAPELLVVGILYGLGNVHVNRWSILVMKVSWIIFKYAQFSLNLYNWRERGVQAKGIWNKSEIRLSDTKWIT